MDYFNSSDFVFFDELGESKRQLVVGKERFTLKLLFLFAAILLDLVTQLIVLFEVFLKAYILNILYYIV